MAITAAQLLGVLADPSANPLPARQGTEEYVVMDSSANIASLIPADIVTGESLGVTAMVTVGTVDVAQAEALEELGRNCSFRQYRRRDRLRYRRRYRADDTGPDVCADLNRRRRDLCQ